MSGPEEQSAGAFVRQTRLAKGISLRRFADMVGVSPTYQSNFEQDKLDSPPTEPRLRQMAAILLVVPDDLLAKARKVSSEVHDIITEQPQFADFLRTARGLRPEDIARLRDEARRLKQRNKNADEKT